jgi:hypothetical protein
VRSIQAGSCSAGTSMSTDVMQTHSQWSDRTLTRVYRARTILGPCEPLGSPQATVM